MRKVLPVISLLLVFLMLFGIVSMAADEEVISNKEILAVNDDAEIPETQTEIENIDDIEGEEAEEEIEELDEETEVTEETEIVKVEESENTTKKFRTIKDKIYDDGIPVLTTSKFFKLFDALRFIKYFLTGKITLGTPKDFEVSVDENLAEMFDDISERSGLDVTQILTNLPNDVLLPAEIATTVFHIDTKEYRDEMYALRDQYWADGDTTKANICWLIGVYMGNLTKADIVLEPKPDTGYYRIKLVVTYKDGGTENFYPNIYINLNTGDCFGENDRGMLSTGFNSNIYEGIVYAPINCWMKNFGFCIEYDLLCYSLPMYNYTTRRFHFDYNNKQYMIQCWKGNYLITTGGEVGIYCRDKGKIGTYYDVVPVEDQLDMSLQIIHGDDILVNVPEQNHWWVNGFKLATVFYVPQSLTMKFTVVCKDEEMLNAFTKSIERNIWQDVTYTTDGLKVYVEWVG